MKWIPGMKVITFLFTLTSIAGMSQQQYSLVVHGGAGRLKPKNFTPERAAKYKAALDSALSIGEALLKDSAHAVAVCEAVVSYLEDNPLFNAGKGSVLNAEGKFEMDASIMDGASQMAGAVSGIGNAKNPIKVAKAIMENSAHVYLSGAGAEQFVIDQNLDVADEKYFQDERRLRQWEKAKRKDTIQLDHDGDENEEKKYGTVGVVVKDCFGDLAAATSTGGMTYKKFGRVGDSPLIGAGTYANNESCAVSCTGHGEYFIRTNAAFDVHALMKYKGLSVTEASNTVIHNRVGALGGRGGMIAIDKMGNVAFAFNTLGMYRAYLTEKGKRHIAIFKN